MKRHNFEKVHIKPNYYVLLSISGEHVQNGDHSDAHVSTFSHSSKEVRSYLFRRDSICNNDLFRIHIIDNGNYNTTSLLIQYEIV